ncbi:MAG: TIGR03668 family PPOX class F420-dependent oxidoreductase [Thermomicrobiales bacterium]|nr:TIGR03668 family PPOX class F420-dependent oxidoreductase [Thermomicrobiales bacterium]MCA9878826.1 TIGR03668 family PPOX class F420-dependent oxidoreductase [Thermomicrobiales bacterium]
MSGLLKTDPEAPVAIGAGVAPGDLAFVRDRRVGHLATADASGTPAVVPVCYAVLDVDGMPAVAIAIDEKPKGNPRALQRVRNILARPEVSLIVDDYSEDWRSLAWVLVRGEARLVEPGEAEHNRALAAVRAKYQQYAHMRLEQLPVILIERLTTTSWLGSGAVEGIAEVRPGRDEFAELVRGRRSVRAFSSRPVARPVIEEAIAAAGWAPSPHGRQPWRFVVVESPARRLALADAMAATWQEQLSLDGQEAAIIASRLARSRDRLIRAPVLIIPCLYLSDVDVYPDADRQAAEELMAVQSLGSAIQNLLLALYAAGVDAGWMCAPLFCPEIVQATLGLSAALQPHALIPVGYAAADPVRRPRRSVDELIVDWQ